jgi:tetratricopeptide (TPR) repeat protein
MVVAWTMISFSMIAWSQENDQEWREFISIGDEHLKRSELRMAEESYLEAHRLAQQFEENDPRRAYTAVKIADTYMRDEDRRAKARTLYEKAAEVFTSMEDDGLEHLAYCEKQLGDLDSFEGQPQKAIERYAKTIRILEVLEQTNDSNLVAALFGIARAERLRGMLPRAEKAFQKLMEKIRTLEEVPTNMGEILAEYANLYWQKGDLVRADALFVEATRRSIAKRGNIHREVADILVRHSQLLAQMKRDQEAKQLADRSQVIYREAH